MKRLVICLFACCTLNGVGWSHADKALHGVRVATSCGANLLALAGTITTGVLVKHSFDQWDTNAFSPYICATLATATLTLATCAIGMCYNPKKIIIVGDNRPRRKSNTHKDEYELLEFFS